jgi:class 3 adenylate cyclase
VAAFAVGPAVAFFFASWALLVFPPETARTGPWRLLPLAFVVIGPGASSWAFDWPFPSRVGWVLSLVGSLAFILVSAALLISSYRRAGGDGRRQIRWVALGFHVGVAPPLLAGLAALVRPELWWLWELSLFSLVAIPLGAAAALAHDRLFDVDGLLTRASSLSLLSLALLALLFFVIPRIGAAVEGVVDPRVAQAGLAVAAAAGLLGLRSALEPRIGRALFAERRRLEAGVQRLLESLGRCEKRRELLTHLGEELRALLEPSCVVVFAPSGAVLAPLYADGPAVAPGFESEGAFARGLERLARPVSRRELARLPTWRPAESEAAALDAMGVDLVLPLIVGGRAEAIVCLGEKGSGDVYSETDRALLGAVVDRACQELARFERERGLERQRERSERLERFVPGAVRERLQGGDTLDARPRQVTVLFVDIRGYTAFSEQHSPGEIFALINRYTEAVSARVREHGGAVVDFSGDGLMAVFGAPEDHPEKERSALRAARAIVAESRELLAEGREDEPTARDVGVGIASGEGFTGTIRSVERDIWCVLGNTTNLAARLQALSRDLEASVVIDEATAAACAGELAGFERVGLRQVRGRSRPLLLHALPRSAPEL